MCSPWSVLPGVSCNVDLQTLQVYWISVALSRAFPWITVFVWYSPRVFQVKTYLSAHRDLGWLKCCSYGFFNLTSWIISSLTQDTDIQTHTQVTLWFQNGAHELASVSVSELVTMVMNCLPSFLVGLILLASVTCVFLLPVDHTLSKS